MSEKSVVNSTWPTAIIAGAFQTGVVAVRNLKRRGVSALCFDCDRELQGFRSVYGPALFCANPDEDVDAWLAFMESLGKKQDQRAVLIPSSDRYVSAIANNHKFLEKLFILSPGADLQGELAEKHSQYRLSRKHGMPMPITRFIESRSDLEKFASDAEYPCVLKPWHFRQWERLPVNHPLLHQKVAVAGTAQELLDYYDSVREFTPSVVAQEVIQGPDTNKRVYLAYYDVNGERKAHAMFKELRCSPIGFGPATVSEPVLDHEADQICDEFLREIGYKGICEIEVKRDSKDDRVKLIEVNPRLSGGGDAAPYAGVDLVWIHYQEMIGRTLDLTTPLNKHFKHIVLRSEGIAIPAYMRAGLLSWGGLLASYRPPIAFFDLEFRDWKISLETIYVFMTSLISSLFRKANSGGLNKHENL